MKLDLDFEQLAKDAKGILKDLLKSTTTGAVEDVENFARDIMDDFVAIMQVPNEVIRAAAVKELFGQVRGLAEKNRLKAVNNVWEAVEKTVALGLNMLLAGIKAAL